jgi:hypothetical protein
MKIQRMTSFLSFAILSSLAVACSGEREIEVTGEVKAPTGSSIQAVTLEFYDLPKEEGGEEKKVDTLKLDKPGEFSKKVSVAGEKIRIFALTDANGDGKCSAGEAWATVEVSIKDDDTLAAPALLELRQLDCPK